MVMRNLDTFLLLTAGALTILCLAVAYSACIEEKMDKDSFIFFVLNKTCTFLLFSKGILIEKTIYQKYSIYLTIYTMIACIYLSHMEKLSVSPISIIIAVDGTSLLFILLGIHNIHKERQLKSALLSGELEILHYTLGKTNEILLFISQFACLVYIMSTNYVLSKIVVVLFLLHTFYKENKYLPYTTGTVVALTFKDIVLCASISNITLFISSAITLGFLIINNYLAWNIKRVSVKRTSIE
ncbi:hypothetical protein NEPAR08_1651 [Nematocida parisii]|nr:hypothetical protein NEPAR08_1651 [Nematocida parisii]